MSLRLEMKMLRHDFNVQICTLVVLLAIIAFSCCIAAEFNTVKVKYMKVDGSLCSLPRTSAFGLGITALVCLSVAQVIGTSAVGTSLCSINKASTKNGIASITLLVLSWVLYGLAAVMLATASSMNNGQPYGKGWMDGECYVVHDGVFAVAAVLIVVIVSLIFGFIFTFRHHSLSEKSSITNKCKDGRNGTCTEGKDVGLSGL